MKMFNPVEYVMGGCFCPSRVGNCCYSPDDSDIVESVILPHENDILFGRGGKNNKHIGNEKLRQIARGHVPVYKSASKKEKSRISWSIVNTIHNLHPPGRFLKRNATTGFWEEVEEEVAREKTSQALRDAVSAYNALKKEKLIKKYEEVQNQNLKCVSSEDTSPPPPPPPPLEPDSGIISQEESREPNSYPMIVTPDRSSSEYRKSTALPQESQKKVHPRVSPVPDIFNEFIGQMGSDMGDFDLFNGALLRKTDSASSGSLSFIKPREKKMRH